jgi:hypothetical protein
MAAAISVNGRRPPPSGFLNTACVYPYVYRISSNSAYICRFYSLNSMAAAAILENGGTLPDLHFLDSA